MAPDYRTRHALLRDVDNVYPRELFDSIEAAIAKPPGVNSSIANQTHVWEVTVYRRGAPVPYMHPNFAAVDGKYEFEETFLYANMSKVNIQALRSFKEWIIGGARYELEDMERHLTVLGPYRAHVRPKFFKVATTPTGHDKRPDIFADTYERIGWTFDVDGALAMATMMKVMMRDWGAEWKGQPGPVLVNVEEWVGVCVQRKELRD
jgi:hypothetical protein